MNIDAILHFIDEDIKSFRSVHGGDINHAYCLQAPKKKFFLKVNNHSRFPQMFEKEKEGLNALQNFFSGSVPAVIHTGIAADNQFILMDWIEKGKPAQTFWGNFGAALATMHQIPQEHFGWHNDNYIGSLAQKNTISDVWHAFYAEMRIMPLIEALFNQKSINTNDVKSAESFCKELKNIFPLEAPSFLHGDLWSGNFMVAIDGNAAIYDPAVYYGHREMDIAMTKLFGGFQNEFYNAYSNAYPLEPGWEKRLPYAQLYPLLVHALLFGGHYVQSVRAVINQF